MLDFMKQNAIFLAVVFGTLLVIVIAYLLYTRKSKSNSLRNIVEAKPEVSEKTFDHLPDDLVEKPEEEPSTEDEVPLQDETKSVAETMEETNESETDVSLVEESDKANGSIDELEQPKPEERTEVSIDLKASLSQLEKEVMGNQAVENEDDSFESQVDSYEDEEGVEDFSGEITTEKKELGKYHIIFRKTDKMWIIKREGSHKVIKTLHTQNEAIAYATIKSIKQKTTYVIHKRDGKIRKQNY
ncbi:MAG: DUF2188 domain-containing protein [Firmicutes bacterium]|nr:DUF2188 domain-containing protein [Bacillota bacterium]